MIRRTLIRSAKALPPLAMLFAGLSLAACSDEDALEHDRGPRIAVDTPNFHQLAARSAPVDIQIQESAPSTNLQQLLGDDYPHSDLQTFELLSTTSARGTALTYDRYTETVAFGLPLPVMWDRIEYKYCQTADVSKCTERSAHVVIMANVNACHTEAITETFFGGTPGLSWLLGAGAVLTSGNADPEGRGWLRLSNLNIFDYSDVLLNVAIPSTTGVSVQFEAAQWGQNGNNIAGDGLLFFMVDGDKISRRNPNGDPPNRGRGSNQGYHWDIDLDDNNQQFRPGARGGSLGYAQRDTRDHLMPGMKHSVFGLGFDAGEFYTNDAEGKIGGLNGEGNSITLRGSSLANWAFLTSTGTISDWRLGCTGTTSGGEDCSNARPTMLGDGRYNTILNIVPVEINELDQVISYRIVVYTQTAQLAPYVLRLDHLVEELLPENVKLGFTGSSGGHARNYNEIRNLAIRFLADLAVEVSIDGYTPSGQLPVGETVTLEYTITNNTLAAVCGASVELLFPEGFTPTQQHCDLSGGGSNATCGAFETTGVTEDYVVLGSNGSMKIFVEGHFTRIDDGQVSVGGRVSPRAGQNDLDPTDNFADIQAQVANAPALKDQTVDVKPNEPKTINILEGAVAGDSPIDPSTATFDNESVPAGVTVTIVNGELTVTMPEGATSPIEITVYVQDEDGVRSGPATITVIPEVPVVVPEPAPLDDSDLSLTGSGMFGCASAGGSNPLGASLAFIVGLGLVLRRRTRTRR